LEMRHCGSSRSAGQNQLFVAAAKGPSMPKL
jgi:hypothetical protein